MLDIDSRPAAASPISLKAIECLNIQISALADGAVFVSMTAITVDDEEPQLLTQEIASERVSTVDDALALVGERIRAVMAANHPAKP
jgi:hypothetical protein